MEEFYYYGFKQDGFIYLLASDDDGNYFADFGMSLESENDKFVQLRKVDIEELEQSLYFDLNRFPLKFEAFTESELLS